MSNHTRGPAIEASNRPGEVGGAGTTRHTRVGRRPTCPVCQEVECLCRPRYFSGQLLTEAELNAEQRYTIEKNRLHNRYLHGWGVVCGLQVVCHPNCKGWVRVKRGYALGPCGEDIVVGEDADFDLIGKIEECERESRRREDCAPLSHSSAECDADGCWCVTIRYEERATRAVTALRPEREASLPACSCERRDCGAGRGGRCCGGSDCGCAHVTNGKGGAPQRSRTPLDVPCEPTRVCEGFELDVCRAPERDRPTYGELLGDTLLGRFYDTLRDFQALQESAPPPGSGPEEQKRFLRQVRDYLESHPTTRCELLDLLRESAGAVNQSDEAMDYEPRGGLLRSLIDSLCLLLLPPCPEDPGDDRVGLASVTVEDGRIVDICNLGCRRQAVTWPAARYWLSALPLEAVLTQLLERLCCGDEGLAIGRVAERQQIRSMPASMGDRADEFALLSQLAALAGAVVGAAGEGG